MQPIMMLRAIPGDAEKNETTVRQAAAKKNGTTDYADYTDFFVFSLCPLWLNYFQIKRGQANFYLQQSFELAWC